MGSKNEKLHSRVVKLEAENASLKVISSFEHAEKLRKKLDDLLAENADLGKKLDKSRYAEMKLEKELATLKKELEVARKAHLERLQELANLKEESKKWNRTFGEVCDEKIKRELAKRYGLLEVKEGLEKKLATLKKQVNIAKRYFNHMDGNDLEYEAQYRDWSRQAIFEINSTEKEGK